jgi:HSP20 family protein
MVKTNSEAGALTRPVEGNLIRWNPFEELSDLRHRVDDVFARAFGYTPLSRMIPTEPFSYEFEPDVDIYMSDEAVEVFAALPGYKPEEITVEAEPGMLFIKGERKPIFGERVEPVRQSWVTTAKCFSAKYSLPVEIDPNTVKAVFHDGVLHLTLMKTERARSKSVKVKILPK